MEASRSGVTVVTGVPRSGTSLMMQMLEAGGLPLLVDGVRGPDCHNPAGYREYDPVRRTRSDASWVARADGRAVKVVHVLVPALPPDRDYRIVLMRRAWSEVLASQRAMLSRAVAPDLPDERLIAVYREQLDELVRWATGRRRASLLPVDYNALLADPRPVAEGIDRFLGGGLDTAAMAAAVDPALYRHRIEPASP